MDVVSRGIFDEEMAKFQFVVVLDCYFVHILIEIVW